MKTLSELKRTLSVGMTLTMTRNDWSKNRPNPLLGIPRKIKAKQTNGIQFEPHTEGKQGSWLYFDSADRFIPISQSEFGIKLDDDGNIMTYKID